MAVGRVRHADIRPCNAQRSAQERQPPEPALEERPRERGDGSGGQDRTMVQAKTKKQRRIAKLE